MAMKKKAAAKKAAPKKKVAAKKATAKKATVKKAAAAAAAPKAIRLSDKPLTKVGLIQTLVDATALSKKEVVAVMDALDEVMVKSLKKHGVFSLSGRMKARVVTKPARKARMGRNPATGETVKIPAKRASKALKVTVLKSLKTDVL